MNYFFTYRRSFPAAHTYGTGRCSGSCGHTWQLEIGVRIDPADPDAERIKIGSRAILDALVDELYGRDLNKQLPASETDTIGVGSWAFERCDHVIKGLAWVKCSIDEEAASIER